MGLYDRDYSRGGPEPGFHLSPPQTATVQIVLLTAAVYLAQLAFPQVTERLSLEADWWRRPWTFFQLLTYGFLHDPSNIEHIAINMLVFWMFGRELEARYGRGEFVTFYLVSIAVAGLVWSLIETALGSTAQGLRLAFDPQVHQWVVVPTHSSVILGASGGIAALVALYAFNWPHRQVLLFFVIPVPMWLAAAIGVGFDAYGAMQRTGDIAFTAHLAGAFFGAAYYWFNLRLAPWVSRGTDWLPRSSKPRLRVVEPDEEVEPEDDLAARVDAILQKIQDQGQDSLTYGERRLLERASREYQQRRK